MQFSLLYCTSVATANLCPTTDDLGNMCASEKSEAELETVPALQSVQQENEKVFEESHL